MRFVASSASLGQSEVLVALVDDVNKNVSDIFRSQWSTRAGRVVPESTDIGLGNDAVELDATVLYADIDGSTTMVDTLNPKIAAELYKSYLICAAKIITSEGGAITAYDGDRIMAVFIGSSKNSSAAKTALKINWATKNIVMPAFQKQYPNEIFTLQQTVGIDTSKLLVAKTGVRGSNDLVWVGSAANYAAKMSAISRPPYATWISHAVFNDLTAEAKLSSGKIMWEYMQWNGRTIYGSSYWWAL
jgi:class 3 adenylate cyclase